MNGPCERCGKRPHSFFTNEGYVCGECMAEIETGRAERERAARVERFRKALMEAHSHDWTMETISEAAHICAAAH